MSAERLVPYRRLDVGRSMLIEAPTYCEFSAVVTKKDGTVVDLGVITSPYQGRFRNWLWKVWKTRDNRLRLGYSRHEMKTVFHAKGLVL